MSKYFRYLIVIFVALIISVILFITGKRHNITLINNLNPATEIKYSVEGEPYKILSAKKKAKFYIKGKSGVIFVKLANDVKTVNLDLDIRGDYELDLAKAISGQEFLTKIVEIEEAIPEDKPEDNKISDKPTLDI